MTSFPELREVSKVWALVLETREASRLQCTAFRAVTALYHPLLKTGVSTSVVVQAAPVWDAFRGTFLQGTPAITNGDFEHMPAL